MREKEKREKRVRERERVKMKKWLFLSSQSLVLGTKNHPISNQLGIDFLYCPSLSHLYYCMIIFKIKHGTVIFIISYTMLLSMSNESLVCYLLHFMYSFGKNYDESIYD